MQAALTMNVFKSWRGTLLLTLAAPALLLGQWPAHLTPAIPKDAKGEPDFTAPAPKTADDKIDLSGLWEMPRRNGRPLTAEPGLAGLPPLATFRDAGANVKDGFGSLPACTRSASRMPSA